MPLAQQAASASASRKQALITKHSVLEGRLNELMHHPSASDSEIKEVKRMKLKVKQELEELV